MMDVKTLCLGLLSLNPGCGYDLKKQFESLFKYFFAAGFGSIYPALADLAEAGLVDCQKVPQIGRPARKVYEITESGRKHFQDALHRATSAHKLRSDFLVMMYFNDQLDAHRLRLLLEDRITEFRDGIAHIERISESWSNDAPAGARFVAGFAREMAAAAATYIEENRHMLEGQGEAQRTDVSRKTRRLAATLEDRI